MKTVSAFAAKFASLITWVLSCFDRVIVKGYLPISRIDQFEWFVDGVLKVRRAEFLQTIAPRWSDRLVEHAKRTAERAGRRYEFHSGSVDKDAWARQRLHDSPLAHGLIGVLCVMEACRTFKLASGNGRPRFASRSVPQRVLYYYYLDQELGFMHVRLQTWAPFTCQVYVNGHD